MHNFTPAEIRFLEEHVSGRRYSELTKLFNERFSQKVPVWNITKVLSKNKLSNGLPKYRFQKGNISPWKGKKLPWFRRKPSEYYDKPIGTERIDKDGYILVKVSQKPAVWKQKHRVIWEAAYGPIPKGHLVMFVDGNKSNTNLDNLLLASCAELSIMQRNGLISADRELTKIGKTLAALKILMRKREKELNHGRKKEK